MGTQYMINEAMNLLVNWKLQKIQYSAALVITGNEMLFTKKSQALNLRNVEENLDGYIHFIKSNNWSSKLSK